MIRTGEERTIWLEHGRRGEVECALAMRRVLRGVFDDLGGSTYGLPVNAVFICDDDAGFEHLRFRQHLLEKLDALWRISVVKHGGTDIWIDGVPLRPGVDFLE